MATEVNSNLTTLDFASIKENLKEYLRSQKIFQDYDFDGSNMSVLLDLMSYNTHMNAFYLNMLSSEMFLDSCLLRDSAVSHAKELNYLPRSFRSATATVDISMTKVDGESSIVIPKGTTFTGTSGNKNFTFTTEQNIQTTKGGDTYTATGVSIYEGDYTYDSYVMNYTNPERFKITNKTVDTNSITVSVIEDNGATTLSYLNSTTLFGLGQSSQVYFIQAAEDDSYEVVFGDDVIGRKPKDGALIIIEYRKCNGELPNGIQTFTADDEVQGAKVDSVTTTAKAAGGSIPESLTSIKYNAPRAFTTQERCVTTDDYETLLKNQFNEINAVSAYGGEENIPPQFGKVIVAVDLKSADELPRSKAFEYEQFIKPRSPLSIDPVFISPKYTYIYVETDVKYNINQTSLGVQDIKTLVLSSIQNHNAVYLNGFNKTLYYSRFCADIDNSQYSVISNDTKVYAVKVIDELYGENTNYDIEFGMRLKDDISKIESERPEDELTVVYSSPFIYNGAEVFIEDDGEGELRMMQKDTEQETNTLVKTIGTVDYEEGILKLESFLPEEIVGNELKFYARVFERDITSQKRTILKIRDEDISINVKQVRI